MLMLNYLKNHIFLKRFFEIHLNSYEKKKPLVTNYT